MNQQPVQPTSRKAWWGIIALIVMVVGYVAVRESWIPSRTKKQPASVPPKPEVAADAYTLGAVLPLSGGASSLGLPMQKAIQLAVAQINAKNGPGKKVNVVFGDGKCLSEDAATAAQGLIDTNHVAAIIGGACSGEVLGLAPIVNKQKVVAMSPSATLADITTKGGPYVYRLAPSDAFAGKMAAAYAANDLNLSRAAVISERTVYAQGLRKSFITAFKLLDGVVPIDETYDTGTTDFHEQARKIKEANVDVVYLLPQSGEAGANILKALADEHVTAKRLTADALLDHELAKTRADVMEGVIGFEPYFQEEVAGAEQFVKDYKAAYHEDPAYPFFMSNAYSEVYLFKDMLDKNNGRADKMQESLYHLKNWNGGSLKDVSFDESGDAQSRTYAVRKIKDGVIETVRTFSLE